MFLITRILGSKRLYKYYYYLLTIILKLMGFNNYNIFYDSGERIVLKLLKNIENPVVLDVGANNGEYSKFLLSRSHASVIAFEPALSCRASLENLKSKYQNRFTFFDFALGEKDGITNFFEFSDSEFSSISDLRDNVDFLRNRECTSIRIKIRF